MKYLYYIIEEFIILIDNKDEEIGNKILWQYINSEGLYKDHFLNIPQRKYFISTELFKKNNFFTIIKVSR